MNTEKIRELRSEEEWTIAHAVLVALRPELKVDEMLAKREGLQGIGYRLFGLFVDGEVVSCASIALHPHLERGTECWVHDLVTADGVRSNGYGARLLQYVAVLASSEGFDRLRLHTRIDRNDAQRFYEEKAGFDRAAVVYQRLLNI